jgi:hypothetical protein
MIDYGSPLALLSIRTFRKQPYPSATTASNGAKPGGMLPAGGARYPEPMADTPAMVGDVRHLRTEVLVPLEFALGHVLPHWPANRWYIV